MERKDFIKGLGIVGIGQMLPHKVVPLSPDQAGGVAACTITASETAGPYPYPGTVPSNYTTSALYRSNIIGDLPTAGGGGAISGGTTAGGGIVLTLTLTIQDKTSCNAISGARVDIWHCDKRGYYSGYNSSQNGGNWSSYTFLRGIQTTNSSGQVTFTSIVPSWYIPRALHIHVQIYLSGSLVLTTQLAFPDATGITINDSTGYNRTYTYRNATDQVFSDGTSTELLTITGSNTAGYAASMTLNADFAALPVKLVDFNASLKNQSVVLNWVTSWEENVSHFEIERADDATSFGKVGQVSAKNAVGTHQYNFTDSEPLRGNGYYRLKSVDLDGQFEYSRIVAVSNEVVKALSVYPNPVKGSMLLEHLKTDENSWATVLNLSGVVLAKIKLSPNTSATNFDVSQLASGTYLLIVNSTLQKSSIRFVVTN